MKIEQMRRALELHEKLTSKRAILQRMAHRPGDVQFLADVRLEMETEPARSERPPGRRPITSEVSLKGQKALIVVEAIKVQVEEEILEIEQQLRGLGATL